MAVSARAGQLAISSHIRSQFRLTGETVSPLSEVLITTEMVNSAAVLDTCH
jgi:hypothetical protein